MCRDSPLQRTCKDAPSRVAGHMIPHAAHGFRGSGLPENLPYLLTLSGYMLIFFVEKVAFDAHHIMEGGGATEEDEQASAEGTTVTVAGSGAAASTGRSATILLLALGVHGLMETMALGLSSDVVSAGLLAMSIGLHQVRRSVSYCFGSASLPGESTASPTRVLFAVPDRNSVPK